MKSLFLIIICVLTFACSQTENSNLQLAASNTNTSISPSAAPNTAKQKAISPDGEIFESLTADSNYFDAVKLLGTPDAETDLPGLKSPIPILLAFYQQNACVVFMNEDKLEEKGLKSNYKYVGSLKVQPLEILHSAEPKNLDFLEAIRTVILKKFLEESQKDSKKKR